ncbi:V-SNARE [Microsporum canis CBS 113480]|uniref:V-SNARE n=1 Tax=Arthroderma otae (strain ATCC MYA-4605 / CBS 113480) TaxID=554155 RepID=C5FRJ5_ARTOC|nr:V-SNARE [Microsporum canis CBS 113480]EEQ32498.1 V-SNARE [Microsporum canis CBS 113480]
MASRFTHSTLHQRDPRSSSSLFDSYNGGSSRSPAQVSSRSPSRPGGYAQGYSNGHIGGVGGDGSTYRTATPNSKGQYSDAVLSSLESQNDSEIAGITAKVKMLKDITVAIGEEIRESSSLAEKMNDAFDSSRVKLRGTMNRMLRMAERTGVGWRVWLGFFVFVFFLFAYVWLS